ncbi:CatB-related O-acetyltransferase [Fictibacillus iocasae]|uniref:CatB-related O-acetyltransferase n=1 Tax=Fictibacillus iocasae TaxID=2715437 RepID=A0ABW2NRW7_9BACL
MNIMSKCFNYFFWMPYLIFKANLLKKSKVSLIVKCDRNTKFENRTIISSLTDIRGSAIGYGSFLGKKCDLRNVKVGRFCSIAAGVKIVRGSHPTHTFVSTHAAFYSPKRKLLSLVDSVPKNFNFHKIIKGNKNLDAIIGNDVWIGEDVKIIKGVTIGDGAIIGTGAIVTKDIEPYTINVGIPARTIKLRFQEDEIEFLKAIEWWTYSEADLKKLGKYFSDIKLFKEKLS